MHGNHIQLTIVDIILRFTGFFGDTNRMIIIAPDFADVVSILRCSIQCDGAHPFKGDAVLSGQQKQFRYRDRLVSVHRAQATIQVTDRSTSFDIGELGHYSHTG